METLSPSGVARPDACSARLEACLEVVTRRNESLRALITVDAEGARRQAKRLDAAGFARGSVAGLIVSLKDNIDTAGLRTTSGSRFLSDHVPDRDAEVVHRLRCTQAVILGKANMHEFAFGATSQNPHHGACRNPWDPTRVPGGSSGGSGVAVASGMCEASLGTDTGGSIRIPAALNGVVGLRPTPGRISNRGCMASAPRFDTIGPIARTAVSTALLYEAVAGYDSGDPGSVDKPVEPVAAMATPPLRGRLIGLPRHGFFDRADPEVEAAVRTGLDILVELGARAVIVETDGARETHDAMACVVRADAAAIHRARLETEPESFGADVLARFRLGLATSPDAYAHGLRVLDDWRARVETLFGEVDYILVPTVGFAAPPIRSTDAMHERTHALTEMTFVWSFCGVPAISIPCGFTGHGLPIGMQLIGRPWSEASLLGTAIAYQEVTAHHLRRPPAVEGDQLARA
jgi:aspartyl-tRNA(Asn)/glutamyl-tRNA(Gln) amidotransferase subunit A